MEWWRKREELVLVSISTTGKRNINGMKVQSNRRVLLAFLSVLKWWATLGGGGMGCLLFSVIIIKIVWLSNDDMKHWKKSAMSQVWVPPRPTARIQGIPPGKSGISWNYDTRKGLSLAACFCRSKITVDHHRPERPWESRGLNLRIEDLCLVHYFVKNKTKTTNQE